MRCPGWIAAFELDSGLATTTPSLGTYSSPHQSVTPADAGAHGWVRPDGQRSVSVGPGVRRDDGGVCERAWR